MITDIPSKWVLKFSEDKRSVATFSGCERYRYNLIRNLTHGPESRVRWLNMLMLNPSTADADKNDPTVARQCKRAMNLGCGGLIVTNIFAWRDTDPRKMRQAEDPIGPENDQCIVTEALRAMLSGGLVIAAWGTHGSHLGRSNHVRSLLASAGVPLYYLRLTKAGEPEHPLYIAYDVQPKRF